MIKIAICDDEQDCLSENKSHLESTLNELRLTAEIDTYLSSYNFLCDIAEDKKHFDLILLDIEMPTLTGMELVSKIKPLLPNVKIIFITSHMEYVLDAFELLIFRYVPKNDIKNRLSKAICDALKLVSIEEGKNYLINTGSNIQKITLKDIIYIKRDGKNSIFITNTDMAKIRKPLKLVYEEIGLSEFLFIDRGVIANIIHIMKVSDECVFLSNGEKLDISRSRLSEVKEQLNTYWGEHI